jgi:hypothetical protein
VRIGLTLGFTVGGGSFRLEAGATQNQFTNLSIVREVPGVIPPTLPTVFEVFGDENSFTNLVSVANTTTLSSVGTGNFYENCLLGTPTGGFTIHTPLTTNNCRFNNCFFRDDPVSGASSYTGNNQYSNCHFYKDGVSYPGAAGTVAFGLGAGTPISISVVGCRFGPFGPSGIVARPSASPVGALDLSGCGIDAVAMGSDLVVQNNKVSGLLTSPPVPSASNAYNNGTVPVLYGALPATVEGNNSYF